MQLYSTNNKEHVVALKHAVIEGLAPDKGLYMPTEIPKLSDDFFEAIYEMSFQEIAFEVAKNLIGDSIPAAEIKKMVEEAIDFEAPVVPIHDNVYSLELFHGPTLAFKDFGARFMSRLMAYFLREKEEEVTILVATSGDTGGAVAQGFYKVPGVKVVVLYPKGLVSPLQEKQFATLGENITAIQIDGTFDDCQRLVKEAFLDEDLKKVKNLSSANSINIARLIPQTFYYFNAFAQLKDCKDNLVFAVPSGNFGNLTAGLIATKMGLPVKRFIASTNANNIVPTYLETGIFKPRPSVSTISNAMDIGNPSNFERMLELCDKDLEKMRKQIWGSYHSDQEVRDILRRVRVDHGYLMDPHGAVGYLALDRYKKEVDADVCGVVLETAHPAKFVEVVEEIVEEKVEVPQRLAKFESAELKAIPASTRFEEFKDYLLA